MICAQSIHSKRIREKGTEPHRFKGDCRDFFQEIVSESVDLAITSPPYNLGKIYEKHLPLDEYLHCFAVVIDELNRILTPTGSVCWQVGNYIHKGEVFPLDVYFYRLFKERDFKLRNRIIWRFNHGLHATKRFSGRYETILWFTKAINMFLTWTRFASQQNTQGNGTSKGRIAGSHLAIRLGKTPQIFGTYYSKIGKRAFGTYQT